MSRKSKYSEELKKKAGMLFSARDANGKRIYTGKALASALGVSRTLAYYLEYQGRKILGTRPPVSHHERKSSSDIDVPTTKDLGMHRGEDIVPQSRLVSVLMTILVVLVVILAVASPFITSWAERFAN